MLNLVNGKGLWESTGNALVLPPIYSRQLGRPKKGRNKTANEKKSDASNNGIKFTKK